MTLLAALGTAGIFLLAAAIQATTGFGFALFSVPLLALLLDPVAAVVATTILSLLISAVVAHDDRGHVRRADAAVVSVAGIAAMPLGLLLLTQLPPRGLQAFIAMVLLVSTALVVRGVRLRSGRATEVAVGATSGALLTSTGMNGPPLVAAFQAQGMPPRQFRGTLSTVFVVQDAAAVLLLALAGAITGEALLAAAIGAPMLVAGWPLGNRQFHRLPPAAFRRVVLALLVVTALVALGEAVRGG
jgi:uncharacterized membrane protein YfcA